MPEYTYSYKREKGYFYPKQEAIIDSKARLCVTIASTKAGKTSSHAIWLAEQAFQGQRGDYFLWVSPTVETSRIGFDLVKNMLSKGGMSDYQTNNQFHSITLSNGTVMRFCGSTNYDSIYGYAYEGIVVDEGSRCSIEAWEACQSTSAHTQCQIKVVGNVTSRNTWFYKLWEKIKAGDIKNAEAHKITVYDAISAGILNKDHIEELRQTYTHNKFKALFECIPSEDLDNPFGIDNIAKCIISSDIEDRQAVVYGIDLAKSIDDTVIVGLNMNNDIVLCDIFQKSWGETKKRIKNVVGETATLVDSTGVGSPIVEELQENLSNVLGYIFTQKSKEQLIDGLIMAIQQQEINIPDYYTELIKQLENFETTTTSTGLVKYSGKRTGGDDCVMALALAWKQFSDVSTYSLLPQIIETQLERWEDDRQWISFDDYDQTMQNY